VPTGGSHLHHYVPRWYQKRFLPAGQKVLCYLDLKPDTVTKGSITYKRKARRFWDPARCFCDSDLYSLRFGDVGSIPHVAFVVFDSVFCEKAA
jgi:hypothetical protein